VAVLSTTTGGALVSWWIGWKNTMHWWWMVICESSYKYLTCENIERGEIEPIK
jgi:hypothetical protein